MKSDLLTPSNTKALFEDKEIRRERHQDEWWFSIVDIVGVLTTSDRASKYRNDLKGKLLQDEGFIDVSDKIGKLKFLGADNKKYPGDGANTKTILRLIQSIPSPKAEPFKQRLASLGSQKMEELNDPELGMQRARESAIRVYQSRGMTDKEIKQRLQMIDSRHDYTDELKARGIQGNEYGILTNISYQRSGKDAQDYKEHKGLLKSDNLRDHMTRTEMLLTELSEETGLEIAKSKDATGFNQVQDALIQGADVAKKTREDIESKTGKSVLDKNNRLSVRQQALRDKANETKKLNQQ